MLIPSSPEKTLPEKREASYVSGVFEIFESSCFTHCVFPNRKIKIKKRLPSHPLRKIPLEFTHGNQNKFANPTSRKQVSPQKRLRKCKITKLVTKRESFRRALLVEDYICRISAGETVIPTTYNIYETVRRYIDRKPPHIHTSRGNKERVEIRKHCLLLSRFFFFSFLSPSITLYDDPEVYFFNFLHLQSFRAEYSLSLICGGFFHLHLEP